MIAEGVRSTTTDGFGARAWSETWLDQLRQRRVPVFAIDNVAAYFYGASERQADLESWAIERDFPLLAPPYPEVFLEFATPKLGSDAPSHAGVLIQAIDLTALPGGTFISASRRKDLAAGVAKTRNRVEGEAAKRGVQFAPWELDAYAWWSECVVGEGYRSDEDVITAAVSFPPPGVRWLLQIHLVLEYGRPIVGPIAGWRLGVTGDGQVARPLATNLVATSYYGPYIVGEDAEAREVLANRVFTPNYLYPTLLALSFVHARNVVIESVTPSPKVAKARQRRTGQPPVRYHVLRIEALKEILKTEGKAGDGGLRQALHLCRGHFKTFTPEAPLLGRHVGTFWWAPQVRGTAKRLILTDYEVQPPESALRDDGHPG